ncbi:MAG: M48 family peptidase, partial [Rhodoferax sp.]|nr:M48 family peptidase [Rhodoferax sp.]
MLDLFNSSSAPLATTLIFALALSANLLLKFWLAGRQISHVARHRSAVPVTFSDKISLVAHHKAADYTIAKTRFGMIELAWGAALAVCWTLLG